MTKPADFAERQAVIFERARNVVVDAGAGTGKTTLVVERLVEMVAPQDDARAAVPLERLAAVTFTRKAAGELRLRVREQILSGLAKPGISATRRARLLEAISGIDHAHIGTIHGFADRLLRMHPVEARLSPSYAILEDADALHAETFDLLMTSIHRGALEGELTGSKAEGRAAEATAVLQDAIAAGIRTDTQEMAWGVRYGLDALFAGMLDHRDVLPPDVAPIPFERATFIQHVDEFLVRAKGAKGPGRGATWLKRAATVLRDVRDEEDVAKIYTQVVTVVDQGGKGFKLGRDFVDDDGGYAAWKAFDGDTTKKAVRATPLRDDLMAPLHAWIARRLVRLGPVLEVLYDKVKTRHRVVDHIDLLLRLRDLLVGNKSVRAQLQTLFAHVFVDEFQDTDPLQAEVMLFLCEDGATAKDAWDAKLAQGKLTIVGDPKQSIYRFRRADVATYDRVRAKLATTKPLEATLKVNFRSTPGLIDWFNDRFAKVLGESKDARFDVKTGQVFHQPLVAGLGAVSEADGGAAADVEVITLGTGAKDGVDVVRGTEARALARYVRWLVEESGTRIVDPVTRERRAVRYGDVAVLAVITTNLPMLCRAFDAQRVPYTTSGGKLFAQDELHQRFVLGLRALADREDGVAEAALMRPPFFAIDLADVALERAGEKDARANRVRGAKEIIRTLRKERAARTPGATARDLIEKSALGRVVALGANGAQRLRHLRELCVELDTMAAREGYDFDAATYAMRQWIEAPPQIDPPRPVDDRAVRVSTVHQAKGLEFPVVVLWDARCVWDTRDFTPAWAVERESRAWAMKVEPKLKWDEPARADYAEKEKKYRDAERRRLVYVAATRARERLVIAVADGGRGEMVNTVLAMAGAAKVERRVKRWGAFKEEGADAWPARSVVVAAPAPREPDESATERDARVALEWGGAVKDSGRARMKRVAASALAKLSVREPPENDEDREPPRGAKERVGRFGPVFGDTVHRAIGFVIERAMNARTAVERAARQMMLAEHLEEAVADVERTVACLRREGLLSGVHRLEYPVAIDQRGAGGEGLLVVGSIDLLCVREEMIGVIDFKTDRAPPEGEPVERRHAAYVAQVAAYARIVERTSARVHGQVRGALLFTEDGGLRYLACAEECKAE